LGSEKKKISNQIKEYKSAAALGGAEEAEVPARGGQRRLAAAELDLASPARGLVDSWTSGGDRAELLERGRRRGLPVPLVHLAASPAECGREETKCSSAQEEAP